MKQTKKIYNMTNLTRLAGKLATNVARNICRLLVLVILTICSGGAWAGIIHFADPKVKEICVKLWDTKDKYGWKDGELSEEEAKVVTSIGKVFSQKTDIVSFDELKHFTGITYIDYYAFHGCESLRSITIPNTVTYISNGAFQKCSSLESITIPENVTYLGSDAFYKCYGLKDVTVKWTIPLEIGDDVFSGVNLSQCKLHIPNGTIAAYQAADVWKDFNLQEDLISFADAKVKEICIRNWDTDGDGELSQSEAVVITDIGQSFKGNASITSFNEFRYFIGLRNIEAAAFQGCTSLKSIILPDSIENIGAEAFKGCKSLQSIIIPKGVGSIEDGTFHGCTSMQSASIPRGIARIGVSAFQDCAALQSVSIPTIVTSIGAKAFSGCSRLKDVTAMWGSPLTIDSDVFEGVESANCTLHIPCETETAYQSANVWNKFILLPDMILFADSQVKQICVENWDTDDDGELSVLEASRVVDIEDKFARTSITSFDELQYFTGLVQLNTRAFEWCESLKSVILPEGLKNARGFWYSAIESVVIPESVTEIGVAAFCGCSALKDVTVKWTTPVKPGFRAFDEIQLENCTLHHPFGTEKIYRSAEVWKEFRVAPDSIVFADPKVKTICLQWDKDGDNHLSLIEAEAVTDLGKGFQSSSITSFDELKYFTGVKSLKATFNTCSKLSSITIPASVDTIENNTFSNCRSLKNLTVEWTTPLAINKNVFKNWSTNTFKNCALNIPLGTLAAYKSADVWKNFKIQVLDIEFADSKVGEICVRHWDADKNGTLSEAEVLDVTELGDVFMKNTEITSFDELKYFKMLTAIEDAAFFGCSSLKSVSVPESVTSIGTMAFSGCTFLQTADIPDGLENVGTQAFYGCISLQSVTIPKGVTRLGNYTFSGCSSLKDVTVGWETPLVVDARVFDGVKSGDCNLHIPSETFPEYSEADVWKEFNIKSAVIEFAEQRVKDICVENWDSDGDGELSEEEAMNVTDLGNVFDNETGITSFNELRYFINLENIGRAAFYGCSSLKSITIPESVTSIGDYAFCECTSLPSISVPEGVTNIGEYAFSKCSALSSMVIPEGVTSIGNGAFKGCTALQSATIPKSVADIEEEAFSACISLKDLWVRWNTPIEINENVFDGVETSNCTLHVPNGVLDAYRSAAVWQDFRFETDMMPGTISGLDRVKVTEDDSSNDETEAVLDLNGRKLPSPQKGLTNIIRTKSGKTIKRIY